jgi:hypothetical protein
MKKHLFTFALIILTSMESFSMHKDTLLNILPAENAWPVNSEKIYTTDHELYDYINGGAELYLQYGFQKLAKKTYTLPDQNELKAEIFDMGQPKNAYGVFSYSRHKENMEIGQGAQQIGSSLIFWQERYFVSLFTSRETDKSSEQLKKAGELISKAIGSSGSLPSVFHIMPKKYLVEGSTFYFSHPAWQNKFTYISNENIFNINEKTLALLSQYGKPEKRYYLLMIEYPDRKKVRKARKKSLANFPFLSKNKLIAENEKGEWFGYELKDNLLIVVLEAPGKEETQYLLKQTLENYNKTKQQ